MQNVKVLERRLTAEEAQNRVQEGKALSMVETYNMVLTVENSGVFGTGKSAV